jgi:hypothetical protein
MYTLEVSILSNLSYRKKDRLNSTKQAISISIGSSKRDKVVEIELLGQRVRLERRGTDGDMREAARLYRDLDGKVDAFGMGGADLGFLISDRWYALHSVESMVREVKHTPIADGTGLKMTLEKKTAGVVEGLLRQNVDARRVLFTSAVDRNGLYHSFLDEGYEFIIGDLMFTLGLPIPIRTDSALQRLARLLVPVISRLPFKWIYPTGESQEKRTPKFEKYFHWAAVIAGDCHFITRYMPDDMQGKIIVTNTTTSEDRRLFREAGVRHLVTTTPMLEGRTFGTNMMEAGILAASEYKGLVDYAHPDGIFKIMENAIQKMNLKPQVQDL